MASAPPPPHRLDQSAASIGRAYMAGLISRSLGRERDAVFVCVCVCVGGKFNLERLAADQKIKLEEPIEFGQTLI